MLRSLAGVARRIPLDELALGLGIGLAVIGVAFRERPLERHVFTCKDRVRAQAIAKAQTALELSLLVHEMQMMGAVGGRRIAQEAPMDECRVERRGYW